jgi:YD repeat-containing protein
MSQSKTHLRLAICLIFIVFILQSVAVPFAESVTYTYDDANRLIDGKDGTGTAIEYTYDDAGNLIQVSAPAPVANFTASPTSGNKPLAVQFTDQSTGVISTRQWNFGDGGTSTLQNPSHTYNTAGDFTVSLTVSGSGGSDVETKTNYIHVIDTVTAITVLSPNGGEIIPSGSTYTIRWSAPSSAVKFDLQYSINNGTAWTTIATNVTGTSYNWSVTKPAANKINCFVKVIGYNSSGVMVGEDKSNAIFTIEVVRLNSPNGGETLTSGTVHAITWTTNGTIRPVANVTLSYSLDGGTTYTSIITLTGNPGSYNWTVPAVTATNCKVKVVLKDSGAVAIGNDVSNNIFTISSSVEPAVTVLSPNGGEIISSGSTYAIKWAASSDAVKFDIQYSTDGGTTWTAITTKVQGTSYNWIVPTLFTANKTNCFVKVIGYDSTGTLKKGEDISNAKFTIEVVRLNSPNGGETLKSGTIYTITWTTNGTIRPVAKVTLSYSLDGGTTYTVIKTLTGNPGTYNWTVPAVTSTNCKVKVVLKDSGAVAIGSDVSNNIFTISP